MVDGGSEVVMLRCYVGCVAMQELILPTTPYSIKSAIVILVYSLLELTVWDL